jgi:hypothetical protein
MGHVTITVADIIPPTQERKRGSIVGIDGTRIGVFAEKVGQFQIGKTYEVDTGDGQYPNVRSAKPTASASAATPFVSGAYRQNAPASAPPIAAPATAFRTPEQMTATEIVCAYIAIGKCASPADLRRTMQEAVNAFRAIWPDEEHYREAAE